MGYEKEDELVFIPRWENEDIVVFCQHCGSLMRRFKDLNHQERKYFCRCGHTEFVSHSEENQNDGDISHINDYIEPTELKRWKEKYLLDNVPNFKCSNCGSEKGELKYKHMRAYSKPTNLFIVCSNCGKMVRKSN